MCVCVCVIESRDFKVCQKLTSSDINETWYDVRGRRNIHDYMTFKVIQGQGQGEEMTSVPYRDYFSFSLMTVSPSRTRIFLHLSLQLSINSALSSSLTLSLPTQNLPLSQIFSTIGPLSLFRTDITDSGCSPFLLSIYVF